MSSQLMRTITRRAPSPDRAPQPEGAPREQYRLHPPKHITAYRGVVDERKKDDDYSGDSDRRFKIVLLISVTVVVVVLVVAIAFVAYLYSPKPVHLHHATVRQPSTTASKARPPKTAPPATTTRAPKPSVAPMPLAHQHEGEFSFELRGAARKFNRYPEQGWIGNGTTLSHLPSGVECCCEVTANDEGFIVCAQGRGSSSELGLEAILKSVKISKNSTQSRLFLVARHQSDLMRGSPCRVSWH